MLANLSGSEFLGDTSSLSIFNTPENQNAKERLRVAAWSPAVSGPTVQRQPEEPPSPSRVPPLPAPQDPRESRKMTPIKDLLVGGRRVLADK